MLAMIHTRPGPYYAQMYLRTGQFEKFNELLFRLNIADLKAVKHTMLQQKQQVEQEYSQRVAKIDAIIDTINKQLEITQRSCHS